MVLQFRTVQLARSHPSALLRHLSQAHLKCRLARKCLLARLVPLIQSPLSVRACHSALLIQMAQLDQPPRLIPLVQLLHCFRLALQGPMALPVHSPLSALLPPWHHCFPSDLPAQKLRWDPWIQSPLVIPPRRSVLLVRSRPWRPTRSARSARYLPAVPAILSGQCCPCCHGPRCPP